MKMIISDEELKGKMRLPLPTLVEHVGRLPEIIIPETLGRPEGTENKDELTKELIARDAVSTTLTQKEVALVHNVTQPEVSFLSRGYDRTNIEDRKVNEEVHLAVQQTKHKIIDRATTRLMETLELFEPSALEQKLLPDAATKMASVIERIEGRGNISNQPPVNFHIYAPRTRHEDQYEVINIHE
jgi:predicted XRE-type DNA-binding protein